MFVYRSKGRTAFMILNFFILTIAALTCILPFVHLLSLSFSGSSAVAAGKVTFFPVDFTTAAYEFALKGGKFSRALGISVVRTILGTVINMILIVITAYPLSHNKYKLMGRNLYAGFFVVTMIIGGGLIPTYILVSKLHLLNSIWALIIPGAVPVYNMIIMMNFMRGLPEEIEDAAAIDGAGAFKTLFMVILPLLKPALATLSLFCIVNHWNDWFGGLIYMQAGEDYPLQTYLHTLLRSMEEMLALAQGDYLQILSMMNARTGRAAQLFLAAIPVLIVYPFLQKYFTSGLVMGSVKG